MRHPELLLVFAWEMPDPKADSKYCFGHPGPCHTYAVHMNYEHGPLTFVTIVLMGHSATESPNSARSASPSRLRRPGGRHGGTLPRPVKMTCASEWLRNGAGVQMQAVRNWCCNRFARQNSPKHISKQFKTLKSFKNTRATPENR